MVSDAVLLYIYDVLLLNIKKKKLSFRSGLFSVHNSYLLFF